MFENVAGLKRDPMREAMVSQAASNFSNWWKKAHLSETMRLNVI
jgi:hypothetical protein